MLTLLALALISLIAVSLWTYSRALTEEKRATELAHVAHAQDLSGQSEALRQFRPAALDVSTKLALEAVSIDASFRTLDTLRANLSIFPPLIADLELPCSPNLAAWDNDKKLLAVGGDNGFCVFDLRDPRLVFKERRDTLDEKITALAFSDAGTLLVASDRGGKQFNRVREFAPSDWRTLHSQEFHGRATRIALSEAHHRLILATDNGDISVRPWEYESIASPKPTLVYIAQGVKDAGFKLARDSGLLFAFDSTGMSVWRDWEGDNRVRVGEIRFQPKSIPFLARLPLAIDEKRGLFMVAANGLIEIRSLEDFELFQEIPLTNVDALAIAGSGWLWAHTRDGVFKAWHRPAEKFVLPTRSYDEFVLTGGLTSGNELAVTEDGQFILAVNRTPNSTESWGALTRAANGEEVARLFHRKRIWHFLSLGPGSKSITVGAEGRLRFWGDNLVDRAQTTHPSSVITTASSEQPDRTVAIATSEDHYNLLRSHSLEIWDMNTATRLSRVAGKSEVLKLIWRGCQGPGLRFATHNALWALPQACCSNSKPEMLVLLPELARGCQRAVAFSNAADVFVTSRDRGRISTLTGSTLAPVSISGLPNQCAESLAVSPDGRTIAISYSDSIQIVDRSSARLIATIPTDSLVRSMSFSQNGTLLALTTGISARTKYEGVQAGFELWSVSPTKRLLAEDLNAEGNDHKICLSPGGSLIATEQGRLVSVWAHDAITNLLQLKVTQQLSGNMISCHFSPDQKTLMVADEFSARVVQLTPQSLIAHAKRKLESEADTPLDSAASGIAASSRQ